MGEHREQAHTAARLAGQPRDLPVFCTTLCDAVLGILQNGLRLCRCILARSFLGRPPLGATGYILGIGRRTRLTGLVGTILLIVHS
jgi:hypothetical protein